LRGTAEQSIKEGKSAINWTRLAEESSRTVVKALMVAERLIAADLSPSFFGAGLTQINAGYLAAHGKSKTDCDQFEAAQRAARP